MAYAVNQKILSSDINGFVSTVNGIWSLGAGDSGYGQPPISGVVTTNKITAPTWVNLISTISSAATHQGTTITAITPPVQYSKINYFSALTTNITSINTNRLNAALQGGTNATTATNSTAWSDYLQFDFIVAFASDDNARYFFNSGGQLGITASHPDSGNINTVINRIAAAMGTIWFSSPTSGSVSLNGISYNGVTKVGGGEPGATIINSSYGFYAWNLLMTQVLEQKETSFIYPVPPKPAPNGYYSSGTKAVITVGYNSLGTLTIRLVFDEIPNGALVASGTTATITVRNPSTTYITDSWGTPTVTSTVTRV